MRLEYITYRIDMLSVFQQHFLHSGMLFVDIETTGLSPATASVYCIGCSCISNDHVEIRLFFAESPDAEQETLQSFFAYATSFSTLITFNGTTFDLPFLQKRASHYQLTDPLCEMEHIDLFRRIKACAPFLQLNGYKQKCIEEFLGIDREDQYNGGQLIKVYEDYCRTGDPDLYHLLYIHNFEDVKGMYDLIEMLPYEQLRQEKYTLEGTETIKEGTHEWFSIQLRLSHPLPQSLLRAEDSWRIIGTKDIVFLRFAITQGTLRHYFEDYRNYFYLPAEQTVIHKSIGQFMDPAFREKAKKENCFIEKKCRYICFECKKARTYLRKEYKDKSYYLDTEQFTTEDILQFVRCFLNALK